MLQKEYISFVIGYHDKNVENILTFKPFGHFIQ
jgi:hypothetical protein